MKKIISDKWRLTFYVLPYIAVILLLKLVAHNYNFEFITLSSLFTALISANIFLVGFLISGVLVDYKESEKIPGEIASSIETIHDECSIIIHNKKASSAIAFERSLGKLTDLIIDWFYKKEKTVKILGEIGNMNNFFAEAESLTQANFISRMKQEQNVIRRLITRAHSIRETSFNRSAYTIAEIITFVLSIGLIFTKIEPFYESIFFVVFVPFILIYMIVLIKDLDNPFDYSPQSQEISGEISLKALLDLSKRIN